VRETAAKYRWLISAPEWFRLALLSPSPQHAAPIKGSARLSPMSASPATLTTPVEPYMATRSDGLPNTHDLQQDEAAIFGMLADISDAVQRHTAAQLLPGAAGSFRRVRGISR